MKDGGGGAVSSANGAVAAAASGSVLPAWDSTKSQAAVFRAGGHHATTLRELWLAELR